MRRRLKIQKIKDIVRLKHKGLSDRQVALALKVSKGSVNAIFRRFKKSGTHWPMGKILSDKEWHNLVYPPPAKKPTDENAIDYALVEKELARPEVTLQILWEEYRESQPDGIGRSMFYEGFRNYRKKSNPTMVMTHKGGDKLYVDYSGNSLCYTDQESGDSVKTQLFVASFGASSYTYVEATHTQTKEDWTMSHVRAFEFFGGLPKAVVPDNLKSAVLKPSLYDPELNPLYASMAEHYDLAVLPARVAKPRDKGVVESNVLHVQRRILAALRDQIFFSLAELNEAILKELDAFNARGMKDYGMQSRKERFESLDQPHLDKISMERFAICALQTEIRVRNNYHILFDSHHYSCPHLLVGERVDVHQVGQLLELYHKGEHIARHVKKPCDHGFETKTEHMPPNHRHAEAQPLSWYIFKGGEIGPSTAEVVKRVSENKRHPEIGTKAARGVLSLARKYDKESLELACKRAVHFGSFSLKGVESILKEGLEKEELPTKDGSFVVEKVDAHDNIRGAKYYGEVI